MHQTEEEVFAEVRRVIAEAQRIVEGLATFEEAENALQNAIDADDYVAERFWRRVFIEYCETTRLRDLRRDNGDYPFALIYRKEGSPRDRRKERTPFFVLSETLEEGHYEGVDAQTLEEAREVWTHAVRHTPYCLHELQVNGSQVLHNDPSEDETPEPKEVWLGNPLW